MTKLSRERSQGMRLLRVMMRLLWSLLSLYATIPSEWLVTSCVRMSIGGFPPASAADSSAAVSAAPSATHSSGLMSVAGALPNRRWMRSRTIGMRVEPPASSTVSRSSALMRASSSTSFASASVRPISPVDSSSNSSRLTSVRRIIPS